MIKTVVKRDGSKQEFNYDKIINAISKAFKACDLEEFPNKYIKSRVKKYLLDLPEECSVEQIQDAVENCLMKEFPNEVARNYIRYRYIRNLARQSENKLLNTVKQKLNTETIANQNANVDEASFGGRIGEASRVVMKQLALDMMSELSRNNHLNNEVYIHDLDSYYVGQHNCLSIPYDKLLANGFKTRQVDIRPANSINTAFQLVAVIAQLQSLQQFGGVSATHLDWTMVPYVRKSFYKHLKDYYELIDGGTFDFQELSIEEWRKVYSNNEKQLNCFYYAYTKTEKELSQAVEGLYHNLNSLQSRSGNQLPFTSINYGTCTSEEGRMVIKALLKGSIKGVGKYHKTSVFPCGIFQYMKGVNDKPGTPNYDLFRLALKSTAQRLYPNYANVDWSGNAGYGKDNPSTYFSTMGCRTVNGYDINGFGHLKDGRGNICPVTIIMPTLAMEAVSSIHKQDDNSKEREEIFLYLLDKKIHEAKDMLIERFNHICLQSPNSAKFMWENETMEGYIPEEGIVSALKHGTLTIGNIGLAETLEILIGKNHVTEEGMILAKKIYKLFADRCKEFKEQYKLNFGVYNTPAENLCHTALLKFRDKYGIIPKVSDKEYFTNSMHVPVTEKIDCFTKIDIESQLTGYSSAGCITYIELSSTAKNNIDALETIVNYAMDKDIPYFAINIPNDVCENCGYQDEIGDNCPECSSNNIKRLRRVTGYLSGDYKTSFNKGKIQETENRVKHISNEIR